MAAVTRVAVKFLTTCVWNCAGGKLLRKFLKPDWFKFPVWILLGKIVAVEDFKLFLTEINVRIQVSTFVLVLTPLC